MAHSVDLPIPDGRSKKRPGVEIQRKRILDAAVELFIQHGSRAVSVSHICAQADVSRPTFYRCFKDKPALIDHIYQSSVNTPALAALQSMPAGQLDDESARAIVDQVLDAIFAQAPFAQLVFVESSDPGSPAATLIDAAFDNAVAGLIAWLTPRSPAPPSRVLLKSLMAACQWIVHDAIRAGLTPEGKREAKDATWQLMGAVIGALQRGP